MVRAATALLGLLLVACAPVAVVPDNTAVPEDWRLVGRLALSNGRDGGSGQLEWLRSGDEDRLRFVGALGRGSWRLEQTPGMALVTLANGRAITALDVDSLVRRELGWEIPVSDLASWVTGEPSPSSRPSTLRDPAGRLEVLEQSGWRVLYEGYLDVDGVWMPRKMTAEKDGNRVRLIVSRWDLGSRALDAVDSN